MDYVLSFVCGAAVGIIGLVAYYGDRRSQLNRDLESVEDREAKLLAGTRQYQRGAAKLKRDQSAHELAANEFRQQTATFNDLHRENQLLKKDLRNLAVEIRHADIDREREVERHDQIQQQIEKLGRMYLNAHMEWMKQGIGTVDMSQLQVRLGRVIDQCRTIGYEIDDASAADLMRELRLELVKSQG